MAKKVFTDESLQTLIDETKSYVDSAVSGKANSNHIHSISNITNLQSTLDGKVPTSRTVNGKALSSNITLSASDVGAAASSHTHTVSNISDLTATATELNYMDGVTSNVQAQLDGKAASSHTHDEYMENTHPVGTGAFSMNRLKGTTIGNFSSTLGCDTTASGNYSHAEGNGTTANGNCSHAEGTNTYANGSSSHAEGHTTTASGSSSHAEGYSTEALDYQHAQGHYNNTSTAVAGTSSGASTGTAFVIGCGTNSSRKNAFRVTYAGKIFATSSTITAGADYAEFFEWQDSNSNNEDRRGYFVTLDGNKIKIAEPDDYILGIVSGRPAIIGNGDEEWMGRYILDEFGDFITEEFEYEENIIDKETDETKIVTKIGIRYKENPNYDSTLPYIQRDDRPEWDAVGMVGVLSVRDDGTCKVNGFCKVAEGGIATTSESGYRVIKRINENIVKVIFR